MAAEDAASVGFSYSPWTERSWSLGAGWAKPSEENHGSNLKDEYVIETSYKLQITKNFSITPDLQWVVNPAKLQDKDDVWIAGLRGIITL